MIVLPNCEKKIHVEFMDEDLKTEIVKKIFEDGFERLAEYVEKKIDDVETLRRKAKEKSKDLEMEEKKKIKKMIEKKEKLMEKEYLKKRKMLRERMEELRREIEDVEMYDEDIIDSIILEEPLIKMVVNAHKGKKKGIFQKIKEIMKKIVAVIKNIILRFLKFLGIIKEKKQKMIYIPDVGIKGVSLDGILTDAMVRSNLEKNYIGKKYENLSERIRLRWEYYFKREEYLKKMAEVINDIVKNAKKKAEKKLKSEVRKKKKVLENLRKEEEKIYEKIIRERKKLEDEEKKVIKSLQKKLKRKISEELLKELLAEIEDMGLIKKSEKGYTVTDRLVELFSSMVLEEELRKIPTTRVFSPGMGGEMQGMYDMRKLLMIDEISRMRVSESMINARINHPWKKTLYVDDLIVLDEKKDIKIHAILLFDKSSSMAENNRLLAAKKSVLALYKAIKKKNSRNAVNLVSFDTDTKIVTLSEIWESESGGFTNVGEALEVAEKILSSSSADLKIIYLITDGLPEAYTENGMKIVGDMKKSMNYALASARKLALQPGIKFTLILLEPKNELFVDAAKKIAEGGRGKLIVSDPQKLTADVLRSYSASF